MSDQIVQAIDNEHTEQGQREQRGRRGVPGDRKGCPNIQKLRVFNPQNR